MNPGKLNKRITILEQSTAQNSYGEEDKNANPNVITTVWANIRPMQGRELFQASQVHAEASTKITIRYRQGILPKMKIKYGERLLEIIGPPINIREENCFLEILCKEVI